MSIRLFQYTKQIRKSTEFVQTTNLFYLNFYIFGRIERRRARCVDLSITHEIEKHLQRIALYAKKNHLIGGSFA